MTKKRLTISLSEEIYNELENVSKKAGLSKSAFITTMILNEGKAQK